MRCHEALQYQSNRVFVWQSYEAQLAIGIKHAADNANRSCSSLFLIHPKQLLGYTEMFGLS